MQQLVSIASAVAFLALSGGVVAYKYAVEEESLTPLPSGYSHAIWEWRGPSQETAAAISQLHDDGFKIIFLEMDQWIDIQELPETENKTEKEAQFLRDTEAYLATASSSNMEVHAVFGGPLWTRDSHTYLWKKSFDLIKTYNLSHPGEGFTGIQYDVEPYKDPYFAQHKEAEMESYVTSVDAMVNLIETSGLSIKMGLAIPYWYDGENEYVPQIMLNGERKYPFQHLANRLNKLSGSYLAIMSYRNEAEGDDGAIAHARQELEFVTAYVPRLTLYVGQETADLTPNKVTYHGLSQKGLADSALNISQYFEKTKSYAGIAVNDVENYLALKVR